MREANGGGGPALTLADFDFDLPENRIALEPARPRDASKLLCISEDGALSDHVFRDLPKLLRAGDLLVFNNTRVIPARLLGQRIRGENRLDCAVLLLKRLDEAHYTAFARPGKRLKPGDVLQFGALTGKVSAKAEDGSILIRFDQQGAALDAAIAEAGLMPLPPYILEARKLHPSYQALGSDTSTKDCNDYQAVFAARDGAVAAPTASLHFTPEVIKSLQGIGVDHVFVTLHVGAGTFLPVKEGDIAHHVMHAEWGEITEDAADHINAARAAGGRVIAVGTTACRLLESAARAGRVEPFIGETDIFIRPGFAFQATDALITNFHLPKSTLLMLVSAFCGLDALRAAYCHAIAGGYRFYSYGDASLVFPKSRTDHAR